MSRIIAVTLVLIILVDNIYHSTASQKGSHVSKVYIRKCLCRVHNQKTICPFPLIPKNYAKRPELSECLCKRFQIGCKSVHPAGPITLL